MRIAILNQFFLPDISPTAQLAGSLAESRANLGDDVTVICGSGNYVQVAGIQRREVAGSTISVIRIRSSGPKRKGLLSRAIAYINFLLLVCLKVTVLPRQDVIVAMTTPPFIVLAGLLHKLIHPRCKIVLWNMDCYPEVAEMAGILRAGSISSRLLCALNRFIFHRLDLLIGLDMAMIKLLVGRYGLRPGSPPCRVIPNWERKALFKLDAPPTPWQSLEKLQLSGQFIVLYLGNAGRGHDFRTVIEAAEQMKHENVIFLFVGGGARWKELAKAGQDRNLKNIILADYVPKEQTVGVMAASNVALITLRDEALGLLSPSKLYANLAMGLPIIYVGPAGSNVDHAIATHGIGVSLRNGDVDNLVDAIRLLQKDRDCYSRLRYSARAAFDAHYSDVQVLPEFNRALAEVTAHT